MTDFRRLLKYLKPHWKTFVIAIIAMIFVALFETALGGLLTPIFNQAFNIDTSKSATSIFNLQSLIPQDDWFKAWLTISVMLFTFVIFGGIAEYFSTFLMAKIGQSAILDLRQELYEHLLKQPAAFFQKHRTNFLVARLVTSSASIEYAVSSNLRDVLRESFNLVFFLSAAFYLNWRLMLGSLIIAPLVAGFTSKFSKKLRKLAEESYDGNKLLTDTAQETLANYPIVIAYRAENRERQRFRNAAMKIARANLLSGRIAALAPPTLALIGVFAITTLLFFGMREINAGNMQPAEFFQFLFFLFRSYDPMRRISRQHNEISKAFAAARDVWDVLDDEEALPEKENAVELRPLQNKIALKNVSFSYGEEDRSVIRNLNLEIPKGQMIALVGESGGGKSSLIKLVQRLYDPAEGEIFWDETDLRDARLASL